jgi:TPR repeat protein
LKWNDDRLIQRLILRSVVTCVLALAGLPAYADLSAAVAAYRKGDFAAAFGQFKELAELGQSQAQLDLAVMYARGEGVTPSKTYAHAWASLASANGAEKAAALRDELQPDLTPTSLQISADIQETRDPARALSLCQSLDQEYRHDPTLWEIRAAAAAATGDFEAAGKDQSEAIAQAQRLQWDLAALTARQSLYASNQPWHGDLLAF